MPKPAWTSILLLMLPKQLEWRHTSLHPSIGCDGVLSTFCQGWPQTTILLISTSQEARITSWRHHFIFWCGIGGWTQGLELARQALYHLSRSTIFTWIFTENELYFLPQFLKFMVTIKICVMITTKTFIFIHSLLKFSLEVLVALLYGCNYYIVC
jgi:hypothetical protein